MGVEERVAEYVAAEGLMQPADRVLVTLSGGADSVALLAVLTALGYGCEAVHCNFHLRGGESDRDERHAVEIARRLGVECHVVHFDVAAYREGHPGESVEMACRALRYERFEQLRQALGCDVIAVAHHRDDQAETFFLNLMRRAGVRGLGGMRPVNGHIVRPLVRLSRADIEEYLQDKGLTYVTDTTNLENEYRRNRIRNVLMPQLRELFADADAAIETSMAHLRQAEAFIDREMQAKAALYVHDGTIDVVHIINNEGGNAEFVLRRLLTMERGGALAPRGIEGQIITAVKAGVSGRVFGEYLLDRGVLSPPIPPPRGGATLDHGSHNEGSVKSWPSGLIKRMVTPPLRGGLGGAGVGTSVLLLSTEAFEGEPVWELRPWRAGDRIKPFGMKGSRLVSDILTDAKVSLADKAQVQVLTRNGEILWIPGFRASCHFPVKPTDTHYYRITSERSLGRG